MDWHWEENVYTQEQYERALALYDWVRGSVTKTDHTAGISSQSANTPQLDYKAQTLTRGTLCLPESQYSRAFETSAAGIKIRCPPPLL